MRTVLLILLSLIVGVPRAASAQTLTFVDALERAATSADRIAEIGARRDTASAGERTALGEVLPVADLNGQYTIAPSTPGIDPATANMRVVADLVRAPAVAAYRAARRRAEAADEGARWDVAGLRYAAATAYVAALAARDNVAAAQSAVGLRDASVEQAHALSDAGFAASSDVSRTELSLVEAQTALVETQLALSDALDALAFLVDLPTVAPEDLVDPLIGDGEVAEVAGANASLRAMELQLVALEALVRGQSWSFAPVISFVGGYRVGAESFRDTRGESVFAVLTATWGIFDFARYGRLDEARAERDAAASSLRLAEREQALEFDGARRRLGAASERLALAETALELAESMRDVEHARFTGGLATALDVVTANADVFRAEIARNLAVLERSTALIDLAYVSGALEETWPR